MHIAICDDCVFDQKLLSEQLLLYFSGKSYCLQLNRYSRGQTLLDDVEEGSRFDVIFLDILLQDDNGLEIARRLRALGCESAIIFCSVSPEYALQGYDVLASGYLTKPYGYARLCACMDLLLRRIQRETYLVQKGRCFERIALSDITYVESCNSKCILHCANGAQRMIYKKLDTIQEELQDARFLRCHQSYLINMDYVCRVDRTFDLITGESVLIRQHDLREIRDQYIAYHAKK